MIVKWYEITCDNCGNAEHFQGSILSAEAQFKFDGGIVTKTKKHYCDIVCQNKKENKQKS